MLVEEPGEQLTAKVPMMELLLIEPDHFDLRVVAVDEDELFCGPVNERFIPDARDNLMRFTMLRGGEIAFSLDKITRIELIPVGTRERPFYVAEHVGLDMIAKGHARRP